MLSLIFDLRLGHAHGRSEASLGGYLNKNINIYSKTGIIFTLIDNLTKPK